MSLEDLFNKGPTDDCGQCEALGAMQKKYLPSIPDLQQTKLNPDNPSSIHHTFWEPANPPDIKQIGRAGWTILHTTATYYPVQPTPSDVTKTRNFLSSFMDVFPCRWCADDFVEIMKNSPPRLNNRNEFEQWMCEAHNEVNQHLGKPVFDCSKVTERWRKETKG